LSLGDLEEIGIHAVGDKKRFQRVLSQLRSPQPAPVSPPVLPPPRIQAPQQGQPPCWDATFAPPPPPPYPAQPFSNSWPCAQHQGQLTFGAPTLYP
jgi:hypothetical protein